MKQGQLQLTPAPCPEHQPGLRADQTEAEPWGGWQAAPACWSVAGFVTKGHVQAETQVISHPNTELRVP